MQQITITRTGGADRLKIVEKPNPHPGPGEILIKVKAAGLNFSDILARQGLYPDAPPLPCCVGYEVSGDVLSVGKGVDTQWLDKPVALLRFVEVVTLPYRT